MSDTVIKGVKRSPSRPASRQSSNTSSAKNRATTGKSATPQPLKKRPAAADKAPARKATKTNSKSSVAAAAKSKTAKTAKAAKTTKSAPVKKSAKATKSAPRATKTTPKTAPKAAPSKSKATAAARKSATVKSAARKQASAPSKPAKAHSKQPAKTAPPTTARKYAPTPPRQPTQDEAAALRAFERAHKEFVRGHFGEARQLFRALVEKHAGVSEVTARARTYLTIAESRLRAEPQLPRDADSLYDRGVIELNRGDYVAAQELFERALKREPAAAHIHYGLAATRSRLGSIDSALESLQRALEIQPTLRIRAQHDHDLTALRNDPEFERMVFAPRF